MKDSYTVQFPSWALSALINGDYSSFSLDEDGGEESTKLVDQFHKDNPGIYSLESEDEGSFCQFPQFPQFGLACDCVELTVIPS